MEQLDTMVVVCLYEVVALQLVLVGFRITYRWFQKGGHSRSIVQAGFCRKNLAEDPPLNGFSDLSVSRAIAAGPMPRLYSRGSDFRTAEISSSYADREYPTIWNHLYVSNLYSVSQFHLLSRAQNKPNLHRGLCTHDDDVSVRATSCQRQVWDGINLHAFQSKTK